MVRVGVGIRVSFRVRIMFFFFDFYHLKFVWLIDKTETGRSRRIGDDCGYLLIH